jgi:NOL1/NOP2/sun family putative RNA methylase
MLPDVFVEQMKGYLGDEFEAFFETFKQPPAVGLRVNTLKISPDAFSSISPYPLRGIPWTKEGFCIPAESRPGKHAYHAAGLYYVQDPSAMAVVELLDPKPGEIILDLAAAPGGKTTHIAAKMQQQGLLIANDIHPRRVRELATNVERWGARNVILLNETPQRLVDHFGAIFDKVLVDAPCSGEGMFRKDQAACNEWTPKFVESCAVRQDDIMHAAAQLVKPEGRLVYATCTFSPLEDEGTAYRFLTHHPEFTLEEPLLEDGLSRGRPGWCREIPDSPLKTNLVRTVRLWPHKAAGEGHFAAIFQRRKEDISLPHRRVFNPSPVPMDPFSYYQTFIQETFNRQPSQDRLALFGSYLYSLPKGMPDLHGLRVIHWGWWLGIMKTKRFEPSHAFVMANDPADFKESLSLNSGDERVMQYIHGEVLPCAGPGGWLVVCVDGFPLGWGKRVRNRIKSHSPRWLRWM